MQNLICKKCKRKKKKGEQWRFYCYQCRYNIIEIEQRKELKCLSDLKCIFCKTKNNIEIHHINKKRDDNSKNNLLKICGHCHKILHNRIYNKIKLQ